MNTYIPDSWVIVEISSPEHGKILKILASWYGGYAGADSWKLSSGIETVKKNSNRYEAINSSGSLYILDGSELVYRMSGYATNVYANLRRQLDEAAMDAVSLQLFSYAESIDLLESMSALTEGNNDENSEV